MRSFMAVGVCVLLGISTMCIARADGKAPAKLNKKQIDDAKGTVMKAYQAPLETTCRTGKAKIRFENLKDTPINAIQMRLHYLGSDGKELDKSPAGIGGPNTVPAKGSAEREGGSFIPDGTTKVTVELVEVKFEDGT